MSFRASCPFCSAKPKFSSKLLGTSASCPECGNHFTAVPFEEIASGPSRYRPVRTAAKASTASVAAADQPANDGSTAENSSLAAPVESDGLPALIIPAWVNVWGLAALLLTGLALLLAATHLARILPILLAAMGMLTCWLGWSLLDRRKFKDVAWLGITGMLSFVCLAVVLCWPQFLNYFWAIDFAVPASDLNQQFRVTKSDKWMTNHALLANDSPVEAEKEAIRQGDVQIRVESVRVELLPSQEPLSDKPSESRLRVNVRITNMGHLHHIAYRSPVNGDTPPQLRDRHGKKYSLKSPPASAAGARLLKPLQKINEVLIYDAPQPGIDYLELEFPSSAWKGQGVCRFRIPGAAIVFPPQD